MQSFSTSPITGQRPYSEASSSSSASDEYLAPRFPHGAAVMRQLTDYDSHQDLHLYYYDDEDHSRHPLMPHPHTQHQPPSSHRNTHTHTTSTPNSPRRQRRRSCSSWSILFAFVIFSSTCVILYLNRSLATFYVSKVFSFTSASTSSELKQPEEHAKWNPSNLELPLPIHLHHSAESLQVQSSYFQLDYYALPPNHRRKVRPVASLQHLTDECLQQWVSSATLCPSIAFSRPTSASLDILYTWVNGSAPHSAMRKLYSESPDGFWDEQYRPDPVTEFNNKQAAAASAPAGPLKGFLEKRVVVVPITSHSSLQGTVQSTGTNGVAKNRPKVLAPPRYKSKIKADNGDNRFRDTSELRYSIRSSVKFIQGLKNIHVVSPDFPRPIHGSSPSPLSTQDVKHFLLPSQLLLDEPTDDFLSVASDPNSPRRAGQIPFWLDTSRPDVLVGDKAREPSADPSSSDSPNLRFHHDWSSFKPSWILKPELIEQYFSASKVEAWKHSVLPTFNSMAIESYLGDEEGLGEVIAYSNDDFFLTNKLTVGDVHTPLFGLVVRFQPHLMVNGRESGFIWPSDHIRGGEWPSLRRSAYLLDQRFGSREVGRPYLGHVHKSMQRALLEESRIMFDAPIRDAAGSRFRGLGESINTAFLSQMFVIERHREALLWTFFVLKHDVDGDGFYARKTEWLDLLKDIGVGSDYSVKPDIEDPRMNIGLAALKNIVIVPHFPTALQVLADEKLSISVPMPKRSTLQNVTETLIKAGLPEAGMSKYEFSSLDGYPFVHLQPYMQDKTMGPSKYKNAQGDKFVPTPGHGASHAQPATSTPAIKEPWPVYWPSDRFREQQARFRYDPQKPACRIELRVCLRRRWVRLENKGAESESDWARGPDAQDVFKRFAFEKPECGDCLIQLMLHKSGERGFSAFLPHESLLFPPAPSEMRADQIPAEPETPHLPLIARWSDIPSFSPGSPFALSTLGARLGWSSASRLRFASSLLSRYAFSLAGSPITFVQVSLGFRNNAQTLWNASGKKNPGFLCVNDDINVGARGKMNGDDQEVQAVVRKFFETEWPVRSQFER